MAWSKERALERIRSVGLIPIVRTPSADDALRAAEAIIAGNIGIAEITMTVPNALGVVEQVAKRFGDHVLLGAGTILDVESCRAAISSGVEFIVTPSLDLSVIETAGKLNKTCIPGALTPTEILSAARGGADLVKVFPAGPVGGPKYIKALKGPFPDIEYVPTGGVTLETTADYIRAGSTAVAVGGELVNLAAIRSGKFEEITASARKFLDAVQAGRAAKSK